MKHILIGSCIIVAAYCNGFLQQDVPSIKQTTVAPPVCINDLSSYANCDAVTTYHFHLDAYVDFTQSAIGGNQTLNMTSLKDGLNQVVIDYQGMQIISVLEQDQTTGTFTDLTSACTHYDDANLGSALIIPLKNTYSKDSNLTLRLQYLTNLNGKAMSWLTEAQTATKIMKYMFTQCEPIYCRSVAPFQDTPSIKSSYSANITAKNPYVVKLSGREREPTVNTNPQIQNNIFFEFIIDLREAQVTS